MYKIERMFIIFFIFSLCFSLRYRNFVIELYPFYFSFLALLIIRFTNILFKGMQLATKDRSVYYLLFLIFISLTLGLLFSYSIEESLSYTFFLYICIIIFLYFYMNTENLIKEDLIFKGFLIIALVQFSLGIIQFFTGSTMGVASSYFGEVKEITKGVIWGGQYRRAIGTFSNPNQYVQFVSLGVAIVLSKYILSKEKIFLFLSLVGLIALFLSFSRGAWLAGILLLVSAMSVVIFKERSFKSILSLVLIISFISIIIFSPLFNVFNIMSQRLEKVGGISLQSAIARISSSAEALEIASKKFFGTGFGNYLVFKPGSMVKRVHNGFLLLLAEGGWLLFLCFTIFCGLVIFKILHYFRKNSNSPLLLASIIFLPTCFLFINIYLSFLQREVLALYCIFFGSVLGIIDSKNKNNGKLHIKHISLFLYSLNGGGIPRHMVNLANGFSKKGYKVDFVLGKAEGSYLKYVSNNINIINLNVSSGFKCIPGLVRYLKKETPQIIYTANTHLNISAIIAYILANVDNTKIVVSEHADFYKAQENRSFPLNYIILAMVKMFYPKADKVVAVSRGVADSIKIAYRLNNSKILTIWNPVITDELYIQAMKPVKHPWLSKNYPIIISIGRLTKQKNYPLLIKAFSRVKESINAKLIILGEGEDREKLEGLIIKLGLERDVDMPGFVDNPYCYLKKADLFVLSSLWEGFSIVLIEALACDTKVISTDCPYGPKEILEYAGTGRLIPADNEEALSDAILEELENDFVKPNLDAFKRDKVVDSYIKLFNDIL